MEQNLKQRLVGALVLISLAVIFLPLVFDGQQQRIDTAQYSIPQKPTIEITAPDIVPLEQAASEQYQAITQIADAKKRQDEDSASFDHASDVEAEDNSGTISKDGSVTVTSPVQQYIEQEIKVDAALQNQPVTTSVPLADAWIIQVGAFSSEANAKGLQSKLKADDYPAFVKAVKVNSGTLFKVYVGPEIRRAQLEQQKIELERKFKLKALILKYIP